MSTSNYTEAQRRGELIGHAMTGIKEFLRSNRGVSMFGTRAEAKFVDGKMIQISCHLDDTSGPTYYEVRVLRPVS